MKKIFKERGVLVCMGAAIVILVLVLDLWGQELVKETVLRESPGGGKIGTLLEKTSVIEIGQTADWVKIRVEGWVRRESLSEVKEGSLQVSDWSWKNVEFLGKVRIEGIVENRTATDFKWVKITVTAKDATGKFLGTDSKYLDPKDIPAGSFSNFVAYINSLNLTDTLRLRYRLSWEQKE